MAQLALIGCSRVILRLACHILVVVAVATTAQYLRVIHLEDRGPAGFSMTILALGGGTYMIERQRHGLHQAGPAVARDTSTWRPFEDARDMAAFTIYTSMSPVEWPTRGEMVKPGTVGRLSMRSPHGQHETSCNHGKQPPRRQSLSACANGSSPLLHQISGSIRQHSKFHPGRMVQACSEYCQSYGSSHFPPENVFLPVSQVGNLGLWHPEALQSLVLLVLL